MTLVVKQPTPSVDERDVERIVRRDFAAGDAENILAWIAKVEVGEKSRVVLACLKIAAGSLEVLRRELSNASGYDREQIGEAEYPLATKKGSRIQSLSKEEVKSIHDSDWRQYQLWLRRS